MPLKFYESHSKTNSIWDFLNVIFRYKYHVLTFFIISFGLITAVTFIMPEIYQSDAKIFIKSGRENLSIDPTVMGPTMSLFQKQEDLVNSEVGLLKSRLLIQRVIEKIGTKEFLKPGKKSFKRKMMEKLGIAKAETKEDKIHRIIVDILDDLSVEVEKNSYMININFQYPDPDMCSKILSTLLYCYMERHIEVNRMQATPEFFKAQTDKLFAEISKKEKALEDYRRGNNITYAENEKDILLEQIKDLHISLNKNLEEADSSRAQLSLYEQALNKPDNIIGFNAYSQQIKLEMTKERAQIQAAEAQQMLINKKLLELNDRLSKLSKHEVIMKRMERDIEIVETEYSEYRNNLQRANISYALDESKVSNVSIIQPATMPLEPVKPNKPLNIALGFLFGILGGVGVAFVADFFDDTFKNNDDIEKRLGLPVLATILREEYDSCI